MMPWFIWKGKNSLNDFGLWIHKLPKRVKAEERVEEIEIPGRAGTVVMLQGEDVYSAYNDEMVVIARNDLHIDRILEWLRGSSELILSTELNKARVCRISGEVAFERVGNSLQQATIPLHCQPFRKSVFPSKDTITISSAGSHTVFNPGDVASKPKVSFSASGTFDITIAGQTMRFYNLWGDTVVDCDAQIIIATAIPYNPEKHVYVGECVTTTGGATWDAGLYRFTSEGVASEQTWEKITSWDGNTYHYMWTGTVVGNFFKIPVGSSTVVTPLAISIEPNWRWF